MTAQVWARDQCPTDGTPHTSQACNACGARWWATTERPPRWPWGRRSFHDSECPHLKEHVGDAKSPFAPELNDGVEGEHPFVQALLQAEASPAVEYLRRQAGYYPGETVALEELRAYAKGERAHAMDPIHAEPLVAMIERLQEQVETSRKVEAARTMWNAMTTEMLRVVIGPLGWRWDWSTGLTLEEVKKMLNAGIREHANRARRQAEEERNTALRLLAMANATLERMGLTAPSSVDETLDREQTEVIGGRPTLKPIEERYEIEVAFRENETKRANTYAAAVRKIWIAMVGHASVPEDVKPETVVEKAKELKASRDSYAAQYDHEMRRADELREERKRQAPIMTVLDRRCLLAETDAMAARRTVAAIEKQRDEALAKIAAFEAGKGEG